jgi:hypothetical protein
VKKKIKNTKISNSAFNKNEFLKHPPRYYLGGKKTGMILFEALKKFLVDLRKTFFQKALS